MLLDHDHGKKNTGSRRVINNRGAKEHPGSVEAFPVHKRRSNCMAVKWI
jgi:hypothetical protein